MTNQDNEELSEGDGSIPDGNLNYLGSLLSRAGQSNFLCTGSDLLHGSHKQIRYDGNSEKAG